MLTAGRGATLVELCVALAVGGLALAVIVATGTRERRLHVALAHRIAGGRQLRHAAEILPIDLRPLDPRSGDIAPGEARDTSLQFRATVAGGVICAISASEVALVPATTRGGELHSEVSQPRPGDTLWALVDDDTTDQWLPARIQSARQASAHCSTSRPRFVDAGDEAAASLMLALSTDLAPLGVTPGSPIRVTRAVRYSVYRASDGGWYLGYRDAAASGGFDVIQPVSGAYPSRNSVRFRYRASNGVLLPTPVDSTRSIATVQIALVTTSDSLEARVALRNAR